jgi:asparagine synthase (glutamine-hydrolysing)
VQGGDKSLCGIVGIYAYGATAPAVDREELQRVRDHMAPRGPDGVGEWFSADGRVGFGHRRLSIVDLSNRGTQPMRSADGRVVVTFNGEIYNYRALRTDLEAQGHIFRSLSDTEVLLHLYAEKGERMVHDLRGMFAFGLWDSDKRELLLARDPYGIKPLYYSDNGQCVRFASQVKSLIAGGRISSTVDPAGLAGFLLFGSVPEPFTIREEVRALPAGCTLRFREGHCEEPKPYFKISEVFADAARLRGATDIDDVEGLVRQELRDSVRHHLVSDVPVGMFLSAGIDSGAVAGLASDILGSDAPPLKTVTVAFEEFQGSRDDEATLAADVARLYKTDHSVRIVRQSEFETDLPSILSAMDQPTIDGINTWFASKAARERGLKVALSGLGGDELFGGYPSFRDIPRWVQTFGFPARLPGLGRAFRGAYSLMSKIKPSFSPKGAGLFEYSGSYPGAYLLRRGLFMPWELPQLLGEEAAREGLTRLQPLSQLAEILSPDPGHPFARVAALEASVYMRNQLLRDTDWASMAHSLEVRVPLVDRKLLEAIAPLLITPGQVADKTWLSRAPKPSLPEAVIKRPKTGFLTPIGEWLQRSRHFQEATNLPRQTHWSRRWALAVLSQTIPDRPVMASAA